MMSLDVRKMWGDFGDQFGRANLIIQQWSMAEFIMLSNVAG